MTEAIGWIGNIILIGAMWGIGDRSRKAFLFQAVGEAVWLVASILMQSYSMMFLCVVFGAIAMRNYIKWKN